MAAPTLATGGLSWLSERERAAEIASRGNLARAAATVEANRLRAASEEDVAARTSGSIRGTGTLTKYGGRPAEPGGGGKGGTGNLRAAAEALEVGGPTSFKGGAGAPPATQIIRGNQITWANPPAATPGGGFNPTPGRTGEEYSSLARAAQAYNRGMSLAGDTKRYGEYEYPDVTGVRALNLAKARVADTVLAQNQQAVQKEKETKATSDFLTTWKNLYAKPTYASGSLTPTYTMPTDAGQLYDLSVSQNLAKTQGPQAAMQHYRERQAARTYLGGINLPSGVDVNAYLDEVAQSPEAWRELMAAAQSFKPPKHKAWYEEPTAFEVQ